VLDEALLAVGEFYLGLAFSAGANTRVPAADLAGLLGALAGALAAFGAGLRAGLFALAGADAAVGAGLGIERLAVPFGIGEMVVGLDEIVDREIVLAFVEAGVLVFT
jgi:hypothetical protein